MATPMTGVVESITSREPRPGMVFFSMQVGGRKYDVGKFAPRGVKAGDTVSFEYDTKQNGNFTNYTLVPRSLRVEAGGAPAAEPTSAPAASSPAPQQAARPAYTAFDERQEIISKQAALNTAQNFVTFAAANGGVAPLPKAAKDGERLTLLRAWLLDEAAKVYKLTTGRDWAMPETGQEPAASPGDRRSTRKPKPETSDTDTGSNEFADEFADDDIPF
jgi:hypothetical protein